jgi:hypothetical protein
MCPGIGAAAVGAARRAICLEGAGLEDLRRTRSGPGTASGMGFVAPPVPDVYGFAQVSPAVSLPSGSGPPIGIPWLSMRE